jgi:hypothetical protein
MIISKELVVANKKKTALVAELRELKFTPFPKGKKAKEMGETEQVLEEEDEGMASDYDYLLGMAIWSLTAEKARCLENGEADDCRSKSFSMSGMKRRASLLSCSNYLRKTSGTAILTTSWLNGR